MCLYGLRMTSLDQLKKDINLKYLVFQKKRKEMTTSSAHTYVYTLCQETESAC